MESKHEVSGQFTESQTTTTLVQQSNPRLCQQCQGWGQWSGVDNVENPMQYHVPYQVLLQNIDCLVCKCVLTVAKAWARESACLRSTPESELVVYVQGPFYLDQLFSSPQTARHRLDLSDPAYLTIVLWVKLDVEAQGGEGESPSGDLGYGSSSLSQRHKKSPPFLTSTPQFIAYYTRDRIPTLCDIKPWNEPYFQVAVLKEWIQNCQINHGNKCAGSYQGGRSISIKSFICQLSSHLYR